MSLIWRVTVAVASLLILSPVEAKSSSSVENVNCTPPAIDDFPSDIFTQEERQSGWVLIHFLVSVYVFYSLAVLTEDYFVPSVECFGEEYQIPSDVLGATLMGVAASSPELFTNVFGTFITEGDIGIGAIVGSAVFNIFGVSALCGILSRNAIPLDWYPITRDSLFYSVSVILFTAFLNKRKIFWYEAAALIFVYVAYLLVMFKNSLIRNWAEKLCPIPKKGQTNNMLFELNASTNETAPLLEKPVEENSDNDKTEYFHLTRIPLGQGYSQFILWLLCWPFQFIFKITIPDCRKESQRKFFPITFLMCTFWMGCLSYVVAWMITVIGYIFSIPDSVMGLTLIAAGTSIPEMVSSVIVSRHGQGNMGLSTSIGSNTFDILICLGLPWLLKGVLIAFGGNEEGKNFIQINSEGLEYSAMSLLICLALLYLMLACNNFYLDKKVGVVALMLYACFLTFASMFEMNLFMPVNSPQCNIN